VDSHPKVIRGNLETLLESPRDAGSAVFTANSLAQLKPTVVTFARVIPEAGRLESDTYQPSVFLFGASRRPRPAPVFWHG